MHARGRSLTPSSQDKSQTVIHINGDSQHNHILSLQPVNLSETSGQKKSSDKVKILVRMRPPLASEVPNEDIIIKEENTIKLIRPDYSNVFMKFDEVLGPKSQQPDIYKSVEHAIDFFFAGHNYNIFAYGQTGAGKTYTVIGDCTETTKAGFNGGYQITGNNRGILPRALDSIMQRLSDLDEECQLMISFYEVYNEKIYDLLNLRESFKMGGLELREGKDGNQIVGLTKIPIRSVREALENLEIGLRNRATGSTHANMQSSRSHSIFEITLMQPNPQSRAKSISSKVRQLISRVVDLAGSEKFSIPKKISKEERDFRIQELTSINGSLSALGHCITALTDSKRTHIPFRSSKLTRVLMDSLSGDSRICFIVCISPALSAATETLSTLQFASRAKKVILDGRHLSKEVSSKKTQTNAKFNDFLEMLKAYHLKHGASGDFFNVFANSKLMDLENEISELRKENEDLRHELNEFKRSCSPIIERHSFILRNDSDLKTPTRDDKNMRSSSSIASRGTREQQQPNSAYNAINRSQSPHEKKVRFQDSSVSYCERPENVSVDAALFENIVLKRLDNSFAKTELGRASNLEDSSHQTNNSSTKLSRSNLSRDNSYSQPSSQQKQKRLENEEADKLLMSKIKQKEFERKYEMFFSDHNSSTTSIGSNTKIEGSENLSRDNGKNRNTSPLSKQKPSQDLQADHRANYSAIDTSENHQAAHRQEGTASTPNKPSQSNQIIDISTEFQRKPSAEILSADTSISSTTSPGLKSLRSALSNERLGSTNNLNMSTQSQISEKNTTVAEGAFLKKSAPTIAASSEDLIKEIDQKLLSVHEMNVQHEELIKNLDKKLEEYQNKTSDHTFRYYELRKLSEKLENEFTNRESLSEFSDIITELKREVASALMQIKDIQTQEKLPLSTPKSSHESDTYNSMTSSDYERISQSRESLRNISNNMNTLNSNEPFKALKPSNSKPNLVENAASLNFDLKYLEFSNALEKQQRQSTSTRSLTSNYESELNKSSSSLDIARKNWSYFKENVK